MKKTIIIATIVLFAGGGLFLALNKDNKPSTSNTSSSATSPTSTTTTTQTSKTFTTAQVAEHNSNKDCWIIVDGSVYDVTNYIKKHPGGTRNITNECGKDATRAFETQGGEGEHPRKAYDQLASLKIGTVQ